MSRECGERGGKVERKGESEKEKEDEEEVEMRLWIGGEIEERYYTSCEVLTLTFVMLIMLPQSSMYCLRSFSFKKHQRPFPKNLR